ncbi:MAG: hypothetical protein AAGK22_27545 [Acidobacteriota bacterium]
MRWFSLLCLALCAAPLAAETPRRPDGKPDLQGVWTNASLTRLSRPASIEELVLSPERAAELAGSHFHNVRAAKDALPRSADRQAPEKLERLPPVGNYNTSYVEPGTAYGVVRGEIRSSWIVEPKDGGAPYRDDLLDRVRARRAGRDTPDDPESFSLGERCLLGFGGTAGPPMLNVLYNNYYRIVQTEDHLVILVEMVHDARIVRLGDEAASERSGVPRWLGDSVGRWEGDTLVVETTSFHPSRELSGPVYHRRDARVVERFTRVAEDEMLYEFSVDDPGSYTHPFRGEMTFHSVESKVYEYACHEGNYAMPTMLKGARLLEREAGEQ